MTKLSETIRAILDGAKELDDVKRGRAATPSLATTSDALANILALIDQGFLQPRANLTTNAHMHVGETIANARAVLAKTRGEQ